MTQPFIIKVAIDTLLVFSGMSLVLAMLHESLPFILTSAVLTFVTMVYGHHMYPVSE